MDRIRDCLGKGMLKRGQVKVLDHGGRERSSFTSSPIRPY